MTVETLVNGFIKVDNKYYVRLPVGYTSDQANNLIASCTCPKPYFSTTCEHIEAAYENKKKV